MSYGGGDQCLLDLQTAACGNLSGLLRHRQRQDAVGVGSLDTVDVDAGDVKAAAVRTVVTLAHLNYGVSCSDIFNTIEQRLTEIRDELGLSYDVETELKELERTLSKDTPVDLLVSRGEYFTSRLMAEYLGYTFVDAADCVIFSFDGSIDYEHSYALIAEAAEKYGRIVIPGFYGRVSTGKIKVMTRGGSDITGSLAAVAVNADVYENWTDVSGILMADPRIVDNPEPIKKITYAELRELAFMGATVLHEESVQPVREKGIPLNIRNTNRPQDPGTMIVGNIDRENSDDRFITGIAGRKNFTIITLQKHDMHTSHSLRQALEVFERYHAPIEHIALGLDSFALVTSSAGLGESIYQLMGDLQKACHPDDINQQDDIALVAAVGRKMPFRPGTSGKLFKALGDAGVNIRTIAQGTDELSIIVGIDNKDYETAIRVLYDGFAG